MGGNKGKIKRKDSVTIKGWISQDIKGAPFTRNKLSFWLSKDDSDIPVFNNDIKCFERTERYSPYTELDRNCKDVTRLFGAVLKPGEAAQVEIQIKVKKRRMRNETI